MDYLADAQTTFYTVGIVFMIFMMVIMTVFLVIAITIASRIRTMQKKIKSKLEMVSLFSRRGKGFMEGFLRGMNQDRY